VRNVDLADRAGFAVGGSFGYSPILYIGDDALASIDGRAKPRYASVR